MGCALVLFGILRRTFEGGEHRAALSDCEAGRPVAVGTLPSLGVLFTCRSHANGLTAGAPATIQFQPWLNIPDCLGLSAEAVELLASDGKLGVNL